MSILELANNNILTLDRVLQVLDARIGFFFKRVFYLDNEIIEPQLVKDILSMISEINKTIHLIEL